MVDVQTVTIVIAGISLVIGVINSIRSNRKAEEQRQTQLATQIYEQLLDPDFTRAFAEMVYQWEFTDYEDYIPKYSITTGHMDEYTKFSRISRYVSHTCELINTGQIELKFVSKLLADNIMRYWEKFRPVCIGSRTLLNNPTAYDNIEAVYPILREQRQQAIERKQQHITVTT